MQVASLQRMTTNGQKFYLEVAWAHEVVLTVGVESLRKNILTHVWKLCVKDEI